MNNANPRCPACGAAIPAAAPGGLCPACLLAGVGNPTDAAPTASAPHRAPPPALAEVAAAFPQLEILELIGQGGMGVVYKARQKSLNRFVALKLLAPQRVADPQFAERFAREARALAALSHPHIVTIHDFGVARADGLQPPPRPAQPDTSNPKLETQNPKLETAFFFLLMEFVDGVNLRQAMKAGRFTPEQALAIVPPVCEALQYAHDHGIVHRDIKPENLLLDKSGRIKIADFGIAKLVARHSDVESDAPEPTDTAGRSQPPDSTLESRATTAGTPGYMAPEQKTSPQRADSRADIYSLGVVLYELLTGELPADKLQPPSRKVQIDVRLDEIVLRALEQTPELRFQTAGEMRTQVVAATDAMHDTAAPAAHPARAASKTAWQSPTLGWGHFIGYLFGITFTSPLAFKLANLSALGFLGFLGFVGLSGVDGLRWCLGFFGFSGFFGLIGVASIVEMAHRRTAKPQVPTDATGADTSPSPQPRLQGWGIVGTAVGLTSWILLTAILSGWSGAGVALSQATVGIIFVAAMVLWNARHRITQFCGHLWLIAVGFLATALFLFGAHWLGLSMIASWPGGAMVSPLKLAWALWLFPLVALRLWIRNVLAPAGTPTPEPPTPSRWQGWHVWTLGLCIAFYGALGLERLSVERFYRSIHDNGNEASDVVFKSALATVLLLAGAAFLWMLGKHIKTPSGSRIASGKRLLGRTIVPTIAVVVLLRAFIMQTFWAATDATAAEIPRGSFVIVSKLARTFATSDLIAYIHKGRVNLGRITETGEDTVNVSRNGKDPVPIPRSIILGKVVSVLWRATPGADAPEVPSPKRANDEKATPAAATTETWSPSLAPPAKPDVRQIFADAQDLQQRGQYEAALQRHLWLHNHGLEVQPSSSAVRRSFWLADWSELARRYPKAKQALLEIRDQKTRELAAGRGHFDLFMDVNSINSYLQDDAATLALFKQIEQSDPQLAKQCKFVVKATAAPLGPASASPQRDVLATLQSDLAALLLTHGQQHPKVVALRARIAALGEADAKATTGAKVAAAIPPHIEFKVLRVENPPGTRDILLHFERDTNAALGLEVWQDVTPSAGLRKQPQPGTYRDSQVKTWAGVYDRVLGWTLPPDFTEAEARAVAKDMEQRAKDWRQLEDGRLWEFGTVPHRDGWKYHLLATVKRAPRSAGAGANTPKP